MKEGDTEEAIKEALRKGRGGGLTSPQIHSVVPGSWEEVSECLEKMAREGVIAQTNYEVAGSDDPYPRYILNERRDVKYPIS